MISLKLKAQFNDRSCPAFIVKLIKSDEIIAKDNEHQNIAMISKQTRDILECTSYYGSFKVFLREKDEYENDIFLCHPKSNKVQRLFRANSRFNSILMTERCDQMCAMCSQPPRRTYDEWRFPLYKKAFELLPKNARITISGGEPTLYKDDLFDILEHSSQKRPDVSFQILSNGQHFEKNDIGTLKKLHNEIEILWGIPLYSDQEKNHDLIVGKEGAFNPLMENLFLLASSNAAIELRTVLTAKNALDLPKLSIFIANHLSFISRWAIMAMEPIGFAKANREQLFFDHSIVTQPLSKTLDICRFRKINVMLFNFPRCTINHRHRKFCSPTISDWKNKFLDECKKCNEKEICTGFFEWYDEKWKWENIKAIK